VTFQTKPFKRPATRTLNLKTKKASIGIKLQGNQPVVTIKLPKLTGKKTSKFFKIK
jgi:hypothetical protein